jgi:Reverse transcriptase (RNA-dependent DNA polymerase)
LETVQSALTVPTVSDRIAQTVVKATIEPRLEPLFHPDSYGYRPGKSALQAVGVTRQRCWESPWVIEFDIQKAFDQPSQCPPQEPTYLPKVRCFNLPAFSLRSAVKVVGRSGKRYSLVRASRVRAIVPL